MNESPSMNGIPTNGYRLKTVLTFSAAAIALPFVAACTLSLYVLALIVRGVERA